MARDSINIGTLAATGSTTPIGIQEGGCRGATIYVTGTFVGTWFIYATLPGSSNFRQAVDIRGAAVTGTAPKMVTIDFEADQISLFANLTSGSVTARMLTRKDA